MRVRIEPSPTQPSQYLVGINKATRKRAREQSDNSPRLVHRQSYTVDGPRLVTDQKYNGPGHLESRDGWHCFGCPGLEGLDGSVRVPGQPQAIYMGLESLTYSTCAYPSVSHTSLRPEAIVFPMLESMAPGSTALQRMPSLRNRQATFLVAPIWNEDPHCQHCFPVGHSDSLTSPCFDAV